MINKLIKKEEPNSFAYDVVQEREIVSRKLLELGSGNGRDISLFVSKGLNVDAVEFSESGVAELHKIQGNLNILKIDILKLKCEKLKYDYIYAFSVLHYFSKEKRQKILKELREGLKDDGKIFIACRSTEDEMAIKSNEDGEFNGVKRKFFTEEELREELTDAGFIVEKLEKKSFKYHLHKEEPMSTFLELVAKKKFEGCGVKSI